MVRRALSSFQTTFQVPNSEKPVSARLKTPSGSESVPRFPDDRYPDLLADRFPTSHQANLRSPRPLSGERSRSQPRVRGVSAEFLTHADKPSKATH
jgi:hypothetical protein